MNTYLLEQAFARSKATGVDRLVLLAIAASVPDDGGDVQLSTAYLATLCRAPEESIDAAVEALVRAGELTVRRDDDEGAAYRVTLGRPTPARRRGGRG